MGRKIGILIFVPLIIMNSLFRMAKGFWPQTIYMLVLPAFFMGFCMLYNPYGIKEYCDFGPMSFGVHLLMLSCIIFLTLVVTRSILPLVRHKITLKWRQYALWCVGEAFIASCFIGLYTALFSKGELPYFQALSDAMKFVFTVLAYPYVFLVMWQIIDNKVEELYEREDSAQESTLVKFYDEHQRLKLTIDSSCILCLTSEYNYIAISYVEGDKVKKFLLRNSMKSQEQTAASHGLVRCHRTCYVNPRHVQMLSKDSGGLLRAVLDAPEPLSVPVSKQYYDALAGLL